MSIREIVRKYEPYLREDKYEDLFEKCDNNERIELIPFLYNDCGINILEFMTTVSRNLFSNTKLLSVTIPENITFVAQEAFYNSAVVEVYMSDSVESIGIETFKDCSYLSKIRLSKKLEKIPNGAFNGCSNLHKIFIPDSVKMFEPQAFEDCANDLLIVANFRNNANDKIRFMANETDFYKSHLRFKRP